MKIKSLAVGMILPLAASVALSTATVASAATPTSAGSHSAVQPRDDNHRGEHGHGGYGDHHTRWCQHWYYYHHHWSSYWGPCDYGGHGHDHGDNGHGPHGR